MPHTWCESRCVKNVGGKCANLACSIPFPKCCQPDGSSVDCSEGIPHCRAGHLEEKLRVLRNYELMHKEDVDFVPHLRKYRFYVGQGIPDPWTSFPYNSGILLHHSDTEKLLKNRKEERCLCCEREYLFECPDKCGAVASRCSCKDCHQKNPTASETTVKCKCSEIFHNWLIENARVHRRKQKRESSRDGGSTLNGSHSETEDEGRHLKEGTKLNGLCECMRNHKAYEYSASENSGIAGGDHEPHEKAIKPSNKIDKVLKQQPKIYFCPYVKHFYRRKYVESEKNLPEPKKVVSKEIQAEIQPIKFSKTVQTEKPETKAQPKCTCQSNCFACSILCNRTWAKATCPAVHSPPNFYCSPGFTQGATFVCPYSFASHCAVQQHCKNEACEMKKRHKKKLFKERENEEGSNAELKFDQQEAKPTGEKITKGKIKEDIQEHELADANDSLKYNKIMNDCQTPSTTFDHLKFLSDYKLKGYIQQEEVSPRISNNKFLQQSSGSRFIPSFRGNPSMLEGVPQERFRSLYYKPRYSESSFVESKMNLGQNNTVRKYNYCNQATMTQPRDHEHLANDALTKDNMYKEATDSDEPKAYGYLSQHEITRILAKRRKLLRNRKRRRKLASSILEYQDCLTKKCGNAKKEARMEESSRNCLKSKKYLNQNFPSTSGQMNFGEKTGLRFTDATLNSRYSIGRNKEEISRRHHLGQFTSTQVPKNY